MLVGVDAGFFYCLKNGDLLAKKVWSEHEVVVSVITEIRARKPSVLTTGMNHRDELPLTNL